MRHYYELSPRGFANEYEIYAVDADLRARFEAAFPGARRITRKQALRYGISRVNEAKRDGEQWFGGLHEEDAARRLPWNATPARRLDACADDTRESVLRVEMEREAADERHAEDVAELADY